MSYRGRNQHTPMTREERCTQLWSRCSNTDDPTACWVWGGSRTGPERMYGKICVAGRLLRTHVQAWMLHHGTEVPEGLEVAHTCHNGLCCNPAHLEAMTHRQNEDAKLAAGRTTTGERNGMARLTEDDVRAIRRRRSEGATLAVIADEFGVSFQHVSSLIRGDRWKAVA